MKDKRLKKRVFSALLAAITVVALLPVPAAAESGTQREESLAGKTISILGDSISTYIGVSDDTSVNATLSGGAIYYTPGRWDVYREDTWWQQTIDALGMELLVNNSWSGSCVLHTRSGTKGAYAERCVQLHNDRTGEEPDVIAAFIAANDFSYYQDALGTADIDYDRLIAENSDGTFAYAKPSTTCEAYAIMLHKMKTRYPDAEIYCMTPTARRDPDKNDGYADVGQPTALNGELMEIMARFDCIPVNLETCGIDPEAEVFDTYMGDGRVHPNAEGMDLIAQALVRALLDRDADLYDVRGSYLGVESDNGAAVAVGGMGYTASLTLAEGYSDLQVTVTMGGVDVTDEVYADGTIRIGSVTGDIVIRAEATRKPMDFRWEFDGAQLECVSDDENELTHLSGSVSNGMLLNTRYSVAKQVQLRHDEPWVVEWKASGSWSALLLSAKSGADDNENTYLFKTNGTNGFVGFGERRGGQFHNYGVELGTMGIDTTQEHIYRIENRIGADGSNLAYLLVDGTDCGAMNHYFIGGSNDQGKTVDWLNGRDFTFSYIGADSHTVNNCYLDYIAVWEDGDGRELSMRYDDRLDLAGKTVEIVDAGKPTSCQVGYGVEENAVCDSAVVTLTGDTLIATGIGTAKVCIDGTMHEVTVTPAPISLLLLIGQSNMEGNEGEASQSIVCPNGMVYATYGDRYDMVLENATHYAPSALTGAYRTVNAAGGTDGLSDYPVYMLTDEGDGRKGPDSGFAYEWVQQTGEKVWIVNAAHGGTSLNVWQPGTTQYEECQAMFGACAETLRKEIAAGHFTLSRMAYFWCQGCNDRTRSAEWYVGKYLSMHESLKRELAFDHDSDPSTTEKTFEFGGIIPVRVGSTAACYRDGFNSDSNPYAYHESFVDLRMSGPRVAQYWMGNNPELTDIWNVCTIGEDWVWMPDGTNGVSAYFNARYPNGTVDYEPQVAQNADWYTPTTPKDVHDSIHYNQIGYNEVGRESVRNALILMGINEDYEEETSVEFVNWTGYQPAGEVAASATGQSGTLVVPIVSPITRCKDVAYTVSDGLDYKYYDLLADSGETTGTLTAVGVDGASVNVVKQEPRALYADHLSQLPERLCRGVNLWAELEHDPLFYYGGTHWDTHSSGTVYSVTFPVAPGDVLYATAWGKAGENGHATANGIRVTFFGEYGVVKTTDPAGTYAEFAANGGYLVAPEGAAAVNIPMWTNEDSNEIYLLSRDHDQSAPICSICGQDSHTHAFSDWQTITLPTETAQGVERRSCSCGETEERKVDGVWQNYVLADHLMELPEEVFCDTNLWAKLEHDAQYFANGIDWGVHPSGKVYSLTLPVSEGERIYASSFGAGGTNGSSSNGIRCTFFDAYGIAKTVPPAEVYAEFAANGYLTAPEGTIAVNVPMWTNDDGWEVYLLDREHHAVNGVCGGCGAKVSAASTKADYKGKVISIMGASIDTFAGWIPTADGFNLAHRARYPDTDRIPDVTSVEQTWWMQLINELDAKLGINDSWAGSGIYWGENMSVQNDDTGEKAAMASLTRIQNLGANGTPDVILFHGGGNDMTKKVAVGSFDPASAPTEVDLVSTQWETFADACVDAVMRMQYYYPDAEIVALLHNPSAYWSEAHRMKYIGVMEAVCRHYGVACVYLENSGITLDHLPDGIHPNEAGMDFLTDATLEVLYDQCDMEPGEHVVYSVTHNLSQVQASLGYYKGVSAGKPFAETLSGQNMTVSVAMGGVDVTDSCYADGKINIAQVTGDVVVTAKGDYCVDGHLQQLPDDICCGVNLWTTLKPENIYYTADGWGNTSAGTSWSVTFPVEAGTRIWATSFGAWPDNGSTANGVRVTWFDEDGLLETVSRDVVYSEFAANGFLTVPEGAVAMNLPMTHNRADYEVYLLSAKHNFGDWAEVTAPACDAEGQDRRVCAVCGEIQNRDTRISGDPDQILVSEPVEEGFYSGKKIVCIGDSITYGVGVENRAEEAYPHLIADLLDMTAVNLGVSGSGYCTGGRMATNRTLTETNVRDADVITILLGINDWAWAVKEGFWNGRPGYYDESETYYQLGEFGSDDTSTFYGALKEWCETIVELKRQEGFEEKQFVVITPMITSWNNSMGSMRDWDQDKTNVHGHTLRQYCTAILEVCAEYGIPVLDANMFSGIYYTSAEDNNVVETGGDGVHINAAGHALLADAIAEFLLEGYRYEARTVAGCGHSYERAVTPPTCTEDGYTTCRCPVCHNSYVEDRMDALGHTWSAGLCKTCGKDTVTAVLDGNGLTLTGELGEGTRIVAACYDSRGQFVEAKVLVWQGAPLTEELPAGETVRLFFTDENQIPLRAAIPLQQRG